MVSFQATPGTMQPGSATPGVPNVIGGSANTVTYVGYATRSRAQSPITAPIRQIAVPGNYATIRGNPFDGHQQPAFASTMSVDPTQGTLITIVLGGNLTMDLPAYFPSGMRITFIFQQPSSGGSYAHTVTFSNAGGYGGGGAWQNVTFTAATGANAFSAVTFASDGYDLVQVA